MRSVTSESAARATRAPGWGGLGARLVGIPLTTRSGLLGLLARLANGRESRRVVAFLVAGGIAALMTLSATATLVDLAHLPFVAGAVIGTELGIIVNFTVNDRLTFVDLPGRRRGLLARVLRFHLTCAVGQSLVLALSLLLHDVAHWRTLLSQALPIVVVTALNFTLHRVWTYRAIIHRAPRVPPGTVRDSA